MKSIFSIPICTTFFTIGKSAKKNRLPKADGHDTLLLLTQIRFLNDFGIEQLFTASRMRNLS